MVFDPSEPEIGGTEFGRQDWRDNICCKFYEYIYSNAPEFRVFGFKTRSFVDSNNAGESVTIQSRTEPLFYFNNVPIHWIYKKQTSIEMIHFVSEFIPMKQ